MAPLEAERQFGSIAFASLVTAQVAELGIGGHARGKPVAGPGSHRRLSGELLNHWTGAAEKPPTARLVDELTRLFVAALR